MTLSPGEVALVIATHETGHAILHYATYAPFRYVTLRPQARSNADAHLVKYNRWSMRKAIYWADEGLQTAGGLVAEALVESLLTGVDYEDHVIATMSGLLPGHNLADVRVLNACAAACPDYSPHAYLATAAWFLKREWATVDVAAAELLRRQTMTGPELFALFESRGVEQGEALWRALNKAQEAA